MIRKKILLIGDFGVGKTSLIRRYVDDTFDDSYLTTIGVKISKKQLEVDGTACELLIWDIEGATPIKHIPQSYFKGASGAIFVCDVDRQETIDSLDEHIERFLSLNPDARYVIAWNKADLLSKGQMKGLEDLLPERAMLTSAKDDVNVSKLFTILTREMLT